MELSPKKINLPQAACCGRRLRMAGVGIPSINRIVGAGVVLFVLGAMAQAQHADSGADLPATPEAVLQLPPSMHPMPAWMVMNQPGRVQPPPHPFWDRTNRLLFSGVAFTRGMDYASTRNFQARGRQEILLPDAVVNNSAGFAGLEAAATASSIGVAYIFHRTGHHTLERWASVGHLCVTGFGDVRNYALKSNHAR